MDTDQAGPHLLKLKGCRSPREKKEEEKEEKRQRLPPLYVCIYMCVYMYSFSTFYFYNNVTVRHSSDKFLVSTVPFIANVPSA